MRDRIAAVEEDPIWIEVNGDRIATLSCTPSALEDLAVGWLFAQGYIAAKTDVLDIAIEAPDERGAHGVRVSVPDERLQAATMDARHRRTTGCGLHHFVSCAPLSRDTAPAEPLLPEVEPLKAMFETLFTLPGHEAGGMHAAGLSDGIVLLFTSEDVGRHNSVDKVIGRAVLAGASLTDSGLVVTSRISGEIAQKAARARLRWIASRSVPTTLAVRIAAAADMPIVARGASRDAAVFLPQQSEPVLLAEAFG